MLRVKDTDRVVGGFTSIAWSSGVQLAFGTGDLLVADPTAFVFGPSGVDGSRFERFRIREDRTEKAVVHNYEHGPAFGDNGDDLCVLRYSEDEEDFDSLMCDCEARSYRAEGDGSVYLGYGLSGGSEYFCADEIEVFAV